MALIGKIVTLFADKEKTLPRFPRTKISAVSDDNGVGLDAILDEMNTDIVETANAINNIDLSNCAQKSDLIAYATKSSLGTQVTYSLNGTALTITTK